MEPLLFSLLLNDLYFYFSVINLYRKVSQAPTIFFIVE